MVRKGEKKGEFSMYERVEFSDLLLLWLLIWWNILYHMR